MSGFLLGLLVGFVIGCFLGFGAGYQWCRDQVSEALQEIKDAMPWTAAFVDGWSEEWARQDRASGRKPWTKH